MKLSLPAIRPLTVSVTEGVFSIHPSDIIRLEAKSNYTRIHFVNQKPILSARVLKTYEHMLQHMGFVRTHRRHLINVQHISHIDKSGSVIMKDASSAAISRRKKLAALGYIQMQR